MFFRTAFGILVCAGVLAAAPPKVPPESRGANDAAEISARLFLGKELVKQALGSDLDGYYIVVEVKLTPKDGNPLKVRRDDFLLKTDKDGERTTPFVPSQIAGAGVLVVSETGGGGGMAAESPGPVWGGTMGRPGRMGGNGANIGNTGTTSTQATISDTSRDKQNPVMRVLSEKILPEVTTEKPVSGLLYFPMDSKQKVKDLQLNYATEAGKVEMRFR